MRALRPAMPPAARVEAARRLTRVAWGLLVVLAAVGHLWLVRLPFPADAALAPPLEAQPGERLVLLLPAAADPLLRASGDQVLELRLDRAHLSLATLALLRSAALDPPSDEGAFDWLAEPGERGGSRIHVALQAPTGVARVELFQQPDPERRQPYFELRAVGAELNAAMASIDPAAFVDGTPRADAPAVIGGAPRRLVGGGRTWPLPAALPLEFAIPDGAALRVHAAGADASPAGPPSARFVFGGSEGGGTLLPVRGAGVVDRDGRWRLLACSAPPRGPHWRGAAALASGPCDRGPASPTLTVAQLRVAPAGLGTELSGRAWLLDDGDALNAPLATRMRNEAPLLAAVAAGDLVLALGAGLPLYRALQRRRALRKADIFISYRRDDSIAEAALIARELATHFGPDRVFIDLDDIRPGDRFLQRITEIIASCRALVVVIGPGWVDARRDGVRRLDDPRDVVRHEIVQALARGIAVVPVLVRGADLPRVEQLPAEVAGLMEHSALVVATARLREDVASLADALEPVLENADEET
ncbi:hypothetical protein dqs_2758 [Azoarcus olearius]|uniref:toll/interleukin-1 receptor domain-containing protein n=1 Tax=Azoarcus sp. (strain BH72) TaxID=418699 RepID=UPI000806412F|nr:toll/interleukin-1 receptor domain-containing protein [Azoarcus olearius]ANQ85787.1 hypothetical protein dqs_2758 [Azoarcus olearius]